MNYNNNINDRKLILKHIKEGNILDLGCGNGSTLKLIQNEYKNSHLYGVDIIETKSKENNLNNIKIINKDIIEFLDNEKILKFDTIILSSTLHELYSFKFNNISIKQFLIIILNKLKSILKEDGIIIIRDGILYDSEDVSIEFNYNNVEKYLNYFIENSLYSRLFDMNVSKINKNKYIFDRHSFYEFMMSYVWSLNNDDIFKHETQEIYGIINLNILKSIDVNIITYSEYLNYGYIPYINQLIKNNSLYTHSLSVIKLK